MPGRVGMRGRGTRAGASATLAACGGPAFSVLVVLVVAATRELSGGVLCIFLKAVQHKRTHLGGAEHAGAVVLVVKKEEAGEHVGPVGDAQPEGRNMPRIRDNVEHGGEALEQGIEATCV
jgi:hypothetical protein